MKTEMLAGWDRSKRTIFDEIVSNYDKIRWEYPDVLYKDIIMYSDFQPDQKALEIGAGTGKATVPFVSAGYDVTAVELGANMTEFLMERFKEYPNFKVINSSFEDAVLEEDSFSLVYAASSFHWVDAKVGCPKVYRILKNGGTFALFRNNTVPAIGEELYEEIQKVYEKYYYTYYVSKERPYKKSKEDYLKASEIYKGYRIYGLKEYGFKDITMKLYDASFTYSADDYIALLDTFSDHKTLPEENRLALYAGVKEAIVRHGGYHKVDYLFQLYMGRK